MIKFAVSMVALVGILFLSLVFQAVAELIAERFGMKEWQVKAVGIVAFCIPIAAVQSI